MTGFMRAWLQQELGGDLVVRDQRVVCVQHLPGAREAMRMETLRDANGAMTDNSMSALRRNCIEEGMDLDEETIKREYGVTKAAIGQFIPIECPKMRMTEFGTLRPWTLDVCFGKSQAYAILRMLRKAFWAAVEEYSRKYIKKRKKTYFAQIDMIEDFCQDKNISDEYAGEIRREWQRRVKRGDSSVPKAKRRKKAENVNLLSL